ncbi:MAG TPA: DUF4097 family beta strand repeat-containing protein [Pyrinomonadaceae bacterium]|jgi:hypothetical protein|nr:DUF4097 family beta strand repeat-containing protein [Pyrinomonadaceae bacterium]
MKLFSDNRQPSKILAAVFSILIILIGSSFALAQQKVSRRYPAGKNVRFELKNITGTITVETWDRDEIAVTALMDNRKATFNPRQTEGGLVIDIVGDNRGRSDIEMNFKIQLPSRSSVDLETHSGQINVRNVQGDLVRAHIWTSGDIQLTGINASRVFASNLSGDIFFDGDFTAGGTYEFKSGRGTISLQLPASCGFHLVATNQTKRISMGPFWDERKMQLLGEGRRITGDVGDGRASVTITSYQGDIKFFRR